MVFVRKIGVGDYPGGGGELDKSSMLFEAVQGENLDHEIEILLLVLEDYDHYFDHLRHGNYCFSSKLDARWTINGVPKKPTQSLNFVAGFMRFSSFEARINYVG